MSSAGLTLGRVMMNNGPMDRAAINSFCSTLPATSHTVQWRGSDVWKVGGKVFALSGGDGVFAAVSFKVTPISYAILAELPGLRPAPYLASRGMKWIQRYGPLERDDKKWEPVFVNKSRDNKHLDHDNDSNKSHGLGLDDDDLRYYLSESYHLVVAKLTRKARQELGLIPHLDELDSSRCGISPRGA